jgi:SAM-dependent methyltransferase
MSADDRAAHWETVYRSKGEREVSWFQETPSASLALIEAAGVTHRSAVIDIGGGASRLVDALLEEGRTDLTVLDLSQAALAVAQARLGARSKEVKWIAADVTKWTPLERYDIWHDRAAFHFLTARADQSAYADCLRAALKGGGHAIIATFAPDGPERCSGLAVVRHDAASIGAVLGEEFKLIETRRHDHVTPMGNTQRFQFSLFRRD